MAQNGNNDRSVRIAVEHRDRGAVARALAAGHEIEERDDIGDTPLLTAAGSGQFIIASELVSAGANIWAYNRFGVTLGQTIAAVRYPPDTPEGQAKLRLIDLLAKRGLAVPGPSPEQVLVDVKRGAWPPVSSSAGRPR